uniref:Biosis of lysosomal organelles complex 1 subunit 2 n=4 Tax=Passeriformes TaxID=9126 RepID=A0A674GQU3_TAEGU
MSGGKGEVIARAAQPHRAQTRSSRFCFAAFSGWGKVTSQHVLHPGICVLPAAPARSAPAVAAAQGRGLRGLLLAPGAGRARAWRGPEEAVPGRASGCAPMAAAPEGPPDAGAQPAKQDPAIETAEEAKEPAEADINELCKDMFSKMATYLTGELTATSEDYKLLENMNKLTSLKYLEMKDIAINISRNLKDLNQKYADLQPYLEQINLIEEQVAALEQAAYKLDAYSKKLEAKYKKLEKR